MADSASPVIRAEALGKRYWVREKRQSLAEALVRRMTGTRPAHQAFWALRDVSFEVPVGSSLGVVGPNGAGKTTLLKILGGITQPSTGRVTVRARLSTQFGLGAGFHSYLSGLENARLQGTILGLTNAEVRRRLPAIVAFAGLDGAMDRPLWTYSSGMAARLGFAVAVHVDFDVLLLDEALNAGDAGFRSRCQERLTGFRAAGKTLVIVSHGAERIRDLCDRALWLDRGQVRRVGPAHEVVDAYEADARSPRVTPS